jgi:hypothetical protein
MDRNAEGTVTTVDRVIDAPAMSRFDVVADASRLPQIDGSGALVATKADAPERLALGSTFGMSMKHGVRYTMANTVVRETWDITGDTRRFFLRRGPLGAQTATHMATTLRRRAEVTES